MKYQVGQKLKCVDTPNRFGHFIIGDEYEIQNVTTEGITILDDRDELHTFNERVAFFNFEPIKPAAKYFPEQIAFLEEHAKAAMTALISHYGEYSSDNASGCLPGPTASVSYTFAEAMLQERTKRLSDK